MLGYWDWLDNLERGVAAHHAGPPAGVQGGRRGALPAQARQGRLRDRDARARHQHARAHRRAREAREVQRRGAGRDHVGGVHPAHRPCRAPRDRRRGPRGHPVDRGPRSAGGRRARVAPHLPAELELPPDVQHGRQPDRPVRARRARARSWSRRSRSSRPTAPSSDSRGRCARQEESLAGYREGDDVRPRRLHRVLRDPPRAERPREAQPQGRERVAGDARQAPAPDRRTAPTDAAAPLPSMPRPRAARALGRAVLEAQAHGRQDAPADRDPHRHGGAHLRPRASTCSPSWTTCGSTPTARPRSRHAGRTMRRIYGERDLLVAESLRLRALERTWMPPSLAALACCLVYEPRRDEAGSGERGLPRGPFRTALSQTQDAVAAARRPRARAPPARLRADRRRVSRRRCTRGRAVPRSTAC